MAEKLHRGNSKVGTLVREAREGKCLSRQALAIEVGVSISTIDRAELNGALPRFEVTARICRRLGLSLDDLGAAVVPDLAEVAR